MQRKNLRHTLSLTEEIYVTVKFYVAIKTAISVRSTMSAAAIRYRPVPTCMYVLHYRTLENWTRSGHSSVW